MSARFGARRRLRAGREFDRVFKQGARQGGSLFVLMAAPNGRGHDRLGLAVGRRLGSAVVRNRARRLLREGFRRLQGVGGGGLDLVVVARADIVGLGQAEVNRELRERVRRIRRAAVVERAGAAAGR